MCLDLYSLHSDLEKYIYSFIGSIFSGYLISWLNASIVKGQEHQIAKSCYDGFVSFTPLLIEQGLTVIILLWLLYVTNHKLNWIGWGSSWRGRGLILQHL